MIDGAARDQAVHERERNVLVDASAGTGKTQLVVDRLIELVAPTTGRDPIPIERIAAITFTRKAAGELRVRARQRILETLATLPPDHHRYPPLLRALGGIDTAHISTIHGFADRLLRKWPSQARLDPQYELAEDDSVLVEECFQLLNHAAETDGLGELLQGSAARDRAEEAMATLRDVQRAGVRLRSLETEHWTYHGIDGLAAGFILHRDIDGADPELVELDRDAFRRYSTEYLELVGGLSPGTPGGRWLVSVADVLRALHSEPDPATMYGEIVELLERGPRGRASDSPTQKRDFAGDERAWDVWRALAGDKRRDPVRATALRDDLLAPLRRWMAVRLARLRPVVLHVYEIVKARHRAVDHVDLLIRLRGLLRDDRSIRRACQRLFDHIFVDEFQDTDPLQAEIVLFLCEQGDGAASWDAVRLAPGTLTLVGDPKQSIYRFRRADLGTYQRVVEIVERSPHLTVTLSSSRRSAPGLVDWINDRFTAVLGASDHGERFRRETGDVYYQRLTKGRQSGADPTVHAVAMELPEGGDVAAYRAFEAAVMARYVRWLVEVSGRCIVDPETQARRPIIYGDIGVLAITTTNLPVLFDAFDRTGVPYAARGGTLFLGDPLQRRFVLGLCALADRDDGVANAALMRPPFFAIDLADLARERRDDPSDRVARVRAVVRELRRRRFERSPGETARALLEQTGFARTIALGPNGEQRLSALQEVCFQVESHALSEDLDFDTTMERLRSWIDRPPGIDRPHPVGSDSVRSLTIHQSKGLEFPVVLLWDARAAWNERITYDAWSADRDGRGWAMRLDGVRWEEPVGLDIAERERDFRKAERKRLVYVAATRARDILLIPKVGAPDGRYILGTLLAGGRSLTVLEQPNHTPSAHAPWFDAATPPTLPFPRETTSRDVEDLEGWTAVAEEAAVAHMRPAAFTDANAARMLWGKRGRFGVVFGETVHLAIGLVLRRDMPIPDAVAAAADRTGLTENLTTARDDVQRALATLRQLGIDSYACELEYPISGVADDGLLLSGYVDLLAVVEGDMVLLDFKTDLPPSEGESPPVKYVAQVGGYAGVVGRAFPAPVRAGLLYTADGSVHWLPPNDNVRS